MPQSWLDVKYWSPKWFVFVGMNTPSELAADPVVAAVGVVIGGGKPGGAFVLTLP